MPNKLLLLLLLLFSVPALCQERTILHGRVTEVSSGDGINDIYVINKKAGVETKTDASGNFEIPAKVNDMLTIYSTKTVVREFAITEASFKETPYLVSVGFQAYQLDEVVINDSVNSVSLGLPRARHVYTPAERKLYTAGRIGIGTLIPIDAIINAISGRTKMLKKAVETEKKEMLMEKIGNIYTEEQIIADFKIPKEYVGGFIYYVVEDKDFAAAMKSKNTMLAKFLMTGLAEKYLKLQNEDEKK
jgi:hypothetical protein